MNTLRINTVWIALSVFTGAPALAQTGHDLFQQALVMEQAEGNLQEAIQMYEQIAEEFSSDRELVARALVQMGGCYEKLGSEGARDAYGRVVREFSDQENVAAQARTRLAALNRASRAAEAPSITTRLVSRERNADWYSITPDGRHAVIMTQETGDLALRDITTGEIRYLTDEASWEAPSVYLWPATVSPVGGQVAYGSWVQDRPGIIRVVDTGGTNSRVLFADQACGVWPFDWSSDGRSLLAGRDCDWEANESESFHLVHISVPDSTARLLKDFGRGAFGGSVAFSPDDRYVVYDVPVEADSGMRDVWALSVDGSFDVPIVRNPANDRLLGWVPGTDEVAFLSDRDGTWDVWAVTVVSGRSQGSPRLLHRNIGEVQSIDFTPDGGLFYQAYTRWFSVSVVPFDAVSGNMDMRSSVAVRGSNMNVAWSPDGRYLASVGEQHGPGGPGFDYRRPLCINDLTTGERHELGRLKQVRRPNWSPDGRSILINAQDEAREDAADRGGLFVVDAETGEVDHVMDVPDGSVWFRGFGAEWLADGASFVYAAFGEDATEGRLVWRELATGTERELLRDSKLYYRILDLHPDGIHLLFGLRERTDGISTDQGWGRLMVLDLETGDRRELHRIQNAGRVTSAEWAPDGGHVFYSAGEYNQGTDMWRVASGGGEPEKLYTFPEDRLAGSFTVSPDGRQIALVEYIQELEIRVMENLREVRRREN